METILIISTFINLITLILLVVVIASYVTLKIKDRKQPHTQKQDHTELVQQEKLPTTVNITNTPPAPVQVSVALSQTNSQSLGHTTRTHYYFTSDQSVPVRADHGSWRLGFRSML